jgi:hypothetical protein
MIINNHPANILRLKSPCFPMAYAIKLIRITGKIGPRNTNSEVLKKVTAITVASAMRENDDTIPASIDKFRALSIPLVERYFPMRMTKLKTKSPAKSKRKIGMPGPGMGIGFVSPLG